MKKDAIVIASWPLSDKNAYSPSLIKDDIELQNSISKYCLEKLTPNNIEIFKQDKNVVVTENGCHGAFWASDLKKVNS